MTAFYENPGITTGLRKVPPTSKIYLLSNSPDIIQANLQFL